MKSRGKSVLLTDANYKHTLAAAKSLHRSGYSVHVVGHRGSLSAVSRYAKRDHPAPSPTSHGRSQQLLAFLRVHQRDVLIPVGAASTLNVALQQDEYRRLTQVPVASADRIEFAMNKARVVTLAEQLGIPVPESVVASSPREAIIVCSDLQYPLVVKSPNEISQFEPQYVASQSEARSALFKLERQLDSVHAPVMLQRKIVGPGEGFFAIYRRGVQEQTFMHRRLREYPISGGSSSAAESIWREDLNDFGSALLDNLEWHGAAMVEFKRDHSSGVPYLLEINPKLWGSLELPLFCGLDLMGHLMAIATEEDFPSAKQFPVGVRFHWPLDGEWGHFIKNPTARRQVLADALNRSVGSNVDLSDPLPIFASLARNALRPLARIV